jgi:hypothetical protein
MGTHLRYCPPDRGGSARCANRFGCRSEVHRPKKQPRILHRLRNNVQRSQLASLPHDRKDVGQMGRNLAWQFLHGSSELLMTRQAWVAAALVVVVVSGCGPATHTSNRTELATDVEAATESPQSGETEPCVQSAEPEYYPAYYGPTPQAALKNLKRFYQEEAAVARARAQGLTPGTPASQIVAFDDALNSVSDEQAGRPSQRGLTMQGSRGGRTIVNVDLAQIDTDWGPTFDGSRAPRIGDWQVVRIAAFVDDALCGGP